MSPHALGVMGAQPAPRGDRCGWSTDNFPESWRKERGGRPWGEQEGGAPVWRVDKAGGEWIRGVFSSLPRLPRRPWALAPSILLLCGCWGSWASPPAGAMICRQFLALVAKVQPLHSRESSRGWERPSVRASGLGRQTLPVQPCVLLSYREGDTGARGRPGCGLGVPLPANDGTGTCLQPESPLPGPALPFPAPGLRPARLSLPHHTEEGFSNNLCCLCLLSPAAASKVYRDFLRHGLPASLRNWTV